MKKITHEIFGVGASLFILMPPITIVGYIIFFSAMGSIVPDVDFKFKHRAFLHNIFSLIFIALILHYILLSFLNLEKYALLFSTSFAVGYFSHILLDSLTKAGVAILWPISNIRLRFLRERYDSPYLNVFVSALGIILMGLYVYYLTIGGNM